MMIIHVVLSSEMTGKRKPSVTTSTMMTIAEITLMAVGILRPRVARPKMTATTMNSIEIMAVRVLARFVISTVAALAASAGTGVTANVLATIEAKAATTRMSVR